jgi:hypothetical protein
VTAASAAESRRYELAIFGVAFAALLLEISYTRVISFKLFYYFTYLVIGFALLGIGSGGVLVSISRRFAALSLDRILAGGCLASSLGVAFGFALVIGTPTDTAQLSNQPLAEISKLLLLCVGLFASFLPVGVMISALLARNPTRIGRLYFADLVGAGAACAVAVPLLSLLSPPGCIALTALLLAALAAYFAKPLSPRLFVASTAAAAIYAVGVVAPGVIPQPVADGTKRVQPDTERVFSEWNPVFRVDVAHVTEDIMFLFHDGMMGSTLHRFDGNLESQARFETDVRSYVFRVADRKIEDVLVIGAAGGHEILASLFFGAEQVTALELNSTTVSLLTEHFVDFSGRLAEHPKVRLVNTEARSHLAREGGRFDLIYFVAPDSYSAQNAATAGAFVLSESYLYTSEMIEESLEHLSEGGIIAMQFGEFFYEGKPNRTARYVATARHALTRMGAQDPARHILVATSPAFIDVSTILVKRTPFTDTEVARFVENAKQVPDARTRHVPGGKFDDGKVNQILGLPDEALPAWFAEQPYDLSPVTDDAPFFWHFTRFRTALQTLFAPVPQIDNEDSLGERLLLFLAAIAAVFAAVFLLLPFLAIRSTWATLPHRARSFGLFAAIGCGFMFFEIALIQKLVLFLGYPTYSLTVTLMSMLVFTGLGSLASTRLAERGTALIGPVFGAIVALTLFYQVGLGVVTDLLLGTPLLVRAATAVVMMAPLGFVLGLFMPLGLSALASSTPHSETYVAWGWAVNGFFSVIGSVLTTILSMTFGFRIVLLLGLAAYAVAAWLLSSLLRGRGAQPSAAR